MTVIVDTSVWIGHLRKSDSRLETLLQEGLVLSHLWVIGELSAGSIRNRNAVIGNMMFLPRAPEVPMDEVLEFIEANGLAGMGLGIVDLQLMASAMLAESGILTQDRAMLNAMKGLGIWNGR